MTAHAVWVTGCGAVSAAGSDARHLASSLRAGCRASGVHPQSDFADLPGARVAGIPAAHAARQLERTAMLFVAAANEAWTDAGLDGCVLDDPERSAVIEGSSMGPLAATLQAHASAHGNRRLHALELRRFTPGEGGAAFALTHGIEGPTLAITTGSVSSASAIGEAFEKIANGTLDLVVAGGAECPFEISVIERFRAAGILSQPDDEQRPCRPFDRTRSGTVLGEGSGVFVLESAAHARRRGARPRAVLAGYGACSSGRSLVAPDPAGNDVRRAATRALGNLPVECIGWIKAHGTGTRLGDAAECRGLAGLFGNRLPGIPITALKPLLGHCLGASGALEAVAGLLALEHGMIPATLGTTRVDPELPNCTVALEPRQFTPPAVLLLSQGFGGRSVALVLSRVD